MAIADTLYSARLPLPELLERGRSNTITCPVYRSGALVAPSAGTVTVTNSGGGSVVAAAAVTITGSVAQYTISSGVLGQEALGDGWVVVWELTLAGTVRTFRTDAACVRAALAPPITDADLYRRVSGLNPAGTAPLSSLTTYQDYLDEAHYEIAGRLIAAGRRPWLVMSPAALRPAYLALTLALIFEDFATRLNPAYAELAAGYRREFHTAWTGLSFHYDEADSGQPPAARRRTARPSLWLSGRD